MALSPRESGKLIAETTNKIKINQTWIEKLGDMLIEEIKNGHLTVESFSQKDFHPKPEDSWGYEWIFLVDTLNFCFWHVESEPGWVVEGQTGYFALCAAINRAMKKGIDILNPNFYSKISEEELLNILRSDNEVQVPLLSERIKCLHEVGEILLKKFDGKFQNCVKQSENNTLKLLDLIVSNFNCFRDEANFQGHKVTIYKRAQILIADIWACYQTKEIGNFSNINELTMFADYRIPQVLLYFKILDYDEDLMKKLQANTILKKGEEDEVVIRGCSIHAIELLTQYVLSKHNNYPINSILIDQFLWDYRRKHATEILNLKIPFHKTFSIFY